MFRDVKTSWLAVGPAALVLLGAGGAAQAKSKPSPIMLNVTRPPVTQTYSVADGARHAPTGHVTIRFCVDRSGNTERARVVGRHGAFDDMALRIIRAARFKPHRENGVPVMTCGITQTINFTPVAAR